jgi:hypothetical protein
VMESVPIRTCQEEITEMYKTSYGDKSSSQELKGLQKPSSVHSLMSSTQLQMKLVILCFKRHKWREV